MMLPDTVNVTSSAKIRAHSAFQVLSCAFLRGCGCSGCPCLLQHQVHAGRRRPAQIRCWPVSCFTLGAQRLVTRLCPLPRVLLLLLRQH